MKRNNMKKIFIAILALFTIQVSLAWADEVVAISPTPSPISIHLEIQSATTTLFDGSLTVEACAPDETLEKKLSGYCAIAQSGLANEWSSFGGDYFLSSVAGAANDYANNQYWGWFADLEYGQTSLLAHSLEENEHLLVTIGRMPLKLAVSTTTPTLNSTTTVSVWEFSFDEAWNPVWVAATSSSIFAGDAASSTLGAGQFEIVTSTTTTFDLFAESPGFLKSTSIKIIPYEVVTTTEATSTESGDQPEADNQNGSGTGGGTGGSVMHQSVNVAKAVQFLLSKQQPDGSFGSGMYTDWAAIAFVAASDSVGQPKIATYLRTSTDSLSSVTDYERRAMALMALGISPYDGTGVNYITRILTFYDGTQIGDSNLVNDDIFALFPLMKAGYSTSDDLIKNITAFIISKQQANGAWVGSTDITGAAVQALLMVNGLPGVSTSMQQARTFLKNNQAQDGGYRSNFSTSWVVQGIVAGGESPSVWLVNNLNPHDYLSNSQQSDGGLETIDQANQNRVWATSYAIPAALEKTWPAILRSFPKQAVQNSITPLSTPTNPVTNTDTHNSTASSSDTMASRTVSTTTQIIPIPIVKLPIKINSMEVAESPREQLIQVAEDLIEVSSTTELSDNPNPVLLAAASEAEADLTPTRTSVPKIIVTLVIMSLIVTVLTYVFKK
jgi:hypothetical protein